MTRDIHEHRLLILDFGSQYTQLIARRVREIGVYCEIFPWDADPALFTRLAPRGVILSGGPESVHGNDTPTIPPSLFDLDVPILGVCYGMQALAAHFDGDVEASGEREFGYAEVTPDPASVLLSGLSDRGSEETAMLDVWMSHGDHVTRAPADFEVVASTPSAPIAAIQHADKKMFGVQFHPEVTHTKRGRAMLERFVVDVCGCATLWTADSIVEDAVTRIREQVGDDEVILGLSGGVDSSVVAALLHRAIGEQLTCIFVDTGLLRYQEGDQVMDTMAAHMGVRVRRVDAAEQFFSALAGETDPEKKRKIIGGEFIKVFEAESRRQKNARWLAQGTIYPDVIESAGAATGKAHVIKSHHNVGGLPDDMELELVEPLRELFKDEVRRIGTTLGLPREMVYRHPFPGPGLGVRILGEVKPQYAELLARADHVFIEALREADLYDQVSQAFAVFLPVKSVGVVGDQRAYEYVVALRAVETIDFMTAHWAHLPYEFLDRVAGKIINTIPGISRVVYDISGKPPATIEWE
ncbi:MAG: glutamine-hydrolyzing GMP synthase [Pseudomonadota bacterium]